MKKQSNQAIFALRYSTVCISEKEVITCPAARLHSALDTRCRRVDYRENGPKIKWTLNTVCHSKKNLNNLRLKMRMERNFWVSFWNNISIGFVPFNLVSLFAKDISEWRMDGSARRQPDVQNRNKLFSVVRSSFFFGIVPSSTFLNHFRDFSVQHVGLCKKIAQLLQRTCPDCYQMPAVGYFFRSQIYYRRLYLGVINRSAPGSHRFSSISRQRNETFDKNLANFYAKYKKLHVHKNKLI